MTDAPLQRAVRYLAGLRQPGPRPLRLPAEFAPQSESEAYRLQRGVARALHDRGGFWKVAMSDADSGTCAPVLASDVYRSGTLVRSALTDRLGLEPEVAFRLQQPLPALGPGRRYTREQVMRAVGSAHAAIEIVISRFQRHETAPPLDRLADNISNGGLVLGPTCVHWRTLDYATLPLQLTIRSGSQIQLTHRAHGGHPLNDPLLPLIWLANHCSALGTGLDAEDVVTTGSYAGLHYMQPGAHAEVVFEGLGAAELCG
jgi:2-keto-4-pentenoate hydratase